MSSQTLSRQTRRTRRTGTLSNQLVRRVMLLSLIAILGLVAAVVVGLVGTLQSTQRQLDEMGALAARAFDDFLSGIENDLLATSGALAATPDASQVFRRALERQSAIFELILVDPQGHVLAQRRRVGEVEPRLAEQPWLATVQAGETYVGPVDYGEYSVPFVDVAVAVTSEAGDFSATLLARVDLTALWDTVIGLRVGESGYVYITDEAGQLLAYRDLQLVRGGVRIADAVRHTPQTIAESGINVYTGLNGEIAIASGVPLTAVPWFAIVEQPVGEALRFFAQLAVVLLALLLIIGLLVYNIILFTRRRIVSPLLLLQEGVNVLRQGNLEHRIDIPTGDELGTLANTFNTMAAQLQEIISTLEQRVVERTRGLQAAAEISHATTSMLDLDELLQQVVGLVRERFDLYHVGLALLDEERRFAVVRAATGAAGQQMIEEGLRLEFGGHSMVGWSMTHAQPRVAPDVKQDTMYAGHPLLPDTRSAAAIPLIARGRVIGALNMESVEATALDEANIAVIQTMTDQVAVAIDNAQLFAEAQAALEEMEATQRRYVGQAWAEYTRGRAISGYELTGAGTIPLSDKVLPEAQRAMTAQRPLVWSGDGNKGQAEDSSLTLANSTGPPALLAPILLRGQPIGALGFKEEGRQWSADDIALAEALAEQFALAADNLRLLDETQRRAARERLTGEITARMRETLDVETVLQTAIREIGETLNIAEVQVRMGDGVGMSE